jgi:hypothetical protein
MYVDGEAGFGLQARHQRLDVAIFKFFGASAHRANKMMPMRSFGGGVTVATFRKVDALNIAQLNQQIQRAIDGSQSQVRIFAFGLAVNLRGCEMMIRLRDDVEYDLAWAGEFAMISAQTGLKSRYGHFF